MPSTVNKGFSRLAREDQDSLSRVYHDYGHLFEKYREERDSGLNHRDALEELYRYAGVAKTNRGLVQRFISACNTKSA